MTLCDCRVVPRVFVPRVFPWILVAAAVGFAACKPKATAPTIATTAEKPPKAVRAAHDGATDQAAVRAVVLAWLDAQNRGQFAAYEALYASKFQGVRRSGPRTRRFNRAGWLQDRKRMFTTPMQVTYVPGSVRVSGAVAIVEGPQTWSSGSYKDAGQKRLLLFREKDAWKIAREEMLQSQIDVKPSHGGQPYLAVYEGNVVFDSSGNVDTVDTVETVNETWFDGPPKLHDFDVLRSLDAKRLPASLSQWQSKKLRVFTSTGDSCTAVISRFRMHYTAEWHFGTTQSWGNGEVPEAEMIQAIVKDGAALMEGVLDERDGNCEGGLVAFDAAKAPRVVLPFKSRKDDAATPLLKSASKMLPKGVSIKEATGYVAAFPRPDATGARRYDILVSSAEDCTSESIGVDGTFIWRSTDQDQQGTLLRRTEQGSLTPLLLVDLDDDGDLELVYSESQSLRVGFADLRSGESLPGGVDVPFYDCPC